MDTMTIPRLRALYTAWETYPPAPWSLARIAAGLGAWKARPQPPRQTPAAGKGTSGGTARGDFGALFGG